MADTTASGTTRPAPNIWSMKKHQSIKHLLLLLNEQLGQGAFVIDDQTDTSARSIYVRHTEDGDVSAYLYTVGQDFERYGVHLEYPHSPETQWVFEAMENLSLGSLVEVLAAHFDIDTISPLPSHSPNRRLPGIG